MSVSWTPVALTPDLPPGGAVPVRAPWGELVVWRSATGRLSCFPERCPHRGMRLSHGFVRGEMISCIYHGWRYDTAGQCRKIPAHPDLEPPAAIRVHSYPVAEAGGLIWIAKTLPESAPPETGAEPLRSLVIASPASAVTEAAGVVPGVPGPVSLPDLAAPLILALQDMGEETAVHALITPADSAARIAASRALEAFRRAVEAEEIAA